MASFSAAAASFAVGISEPCAPPVRPLGTRVVSPPLRSVVARSGTLPAIGAWAGAGLAAGACAGAGLAAGA
ncbi:hypothetical protein FPZ41_11740 [Streptomyces sp. K1PN6]|uniref:Uncharacterized protein n=1 Tax=Streptomyces acidicola TaxID=2596892 RepID=A0A5N8WP52_9ACTN|nr:hypothetical protein [Streptomyces acidicola]